MRRRDVDHGWAWVAFGAMYLTQMLTGGHALNTGIFFSIFQDAYQKPRRDTMWLMSMNGTASSLAGILAGILASRYGARTTMMVGALFLGLPTALLFFSNSLPYAIVFYGLSGIAVPLLLTSVLAGLAQYFHKHLYLVMGLVSTSSGVGTTIIGNEMEWALDTFGWRMTMLIQGAIILQICVCAALMFNNVEPEENCNDVASDQGPTTKREPAKKLQMSEYWFDRRFILLTFGYVTFTAAREIFQYILKDLYRSLMPIGAPASFSYSTVITCFGVSSTIGRLVSGLFTLILSPPQANIISSSICTLGILSLISALSLSAVFLLIGVVAIGFTFGQQAVYQKQSWGYIFSPEIMASLYGYSCIFTGLPRFAVPPVAGFIKDATNSYEMVILLAVIFMVMSTASYWAAYLTAFPSDACSFRYCRRPKQNMELAEIETVQSEIKL